jgi:hypothetical protein
MSSKPIPTPESFEELLARTTTIRILDWDFHSDPPNVGTTLVFETESPADVVLFGSAFEIQPSEPFHCMCAGELLIELRGPAGPFIELTLHHGKSIRWAGWSSDALLKNGRAAVQWLAERGVEQPLRNFEAAESQRGLAREAKRRWQEAMPPCLIQFLPRLIGYFFAFEATAAELQALDHALEAAYGSEEEIVIHLLDWFGHGEGPWSGFPSYEHIAQKLLRRHSSSVIVRSLEGRQLTSEQAEAVARLFSSFSFAKERQTDLKSIPPELMARLASHMQTSDYADNRERFQKTFGRWAAGSNGVG